MQFIRSQNPKLASKMLEKRLVKELQSVHNKRVLWLLSGGSNIALSVAIMQRLPEDLTSKLAVALADERFGPVGHADSNFQQLIAAGFDTKQATVVPVLLPGIELAETRKRYEEVIVTAFDAADVIIAQFGIGSDGHIAGILPQTKIVTSSDMVVAYDTPQYIRISLSLEAIKRIPIAYTFAFGADKRAALDQLCNHDLSPNQQPAQILKQITECYLYNDYVEGSI